ncbi:uncharacterized protein BDR25DRAFT_342172 [Lindgomyces ingoldianus]|uniref:Uncharacterized protein n=1 Tax=Lindgomyces ingoldianus TaxID=673940 RepID=A0ACB6QZ45_9PLEO|nr:uncharacterized protein BDR25DRAFT_342172 [Lindgomyces ingoldianus]KAF2472186.1 hypothetical protein BDR25DRAFT_342172 [Lindgomyces ingoldianus]
MSLAYKVEELLALRDSVSESAVSIDKFADEDVIKGWICAAARKNLAPAPPSRGAIRTKEFSALTFSSCRTPGRQKAFFASACHLQVEPPANFASEHVLRPSASANVIGFSSEKASRLSMTPGVASAAAGKKPSPSPSVKRGKAEKLLKEHGSPPGMRVTAGGRVVPSDLPPLGSARFASNGFKPQPQRTVTPGNVLPGQAQLDVNSLSQSIQLIGGQPVLCVGDRIFQIPTYAQNQNALGAFVPTLTDTTRPTGDTTMSSLPVSYHGATGTASQVNGGASADGQTPLSTFLGVDLNTLKQRQLFKKAELKNLEQTEVLQASHQSEAWRAAMISKKKSLILELDALRKQVMALEGATTSTSQTVALPHPNVSVTVPPGATFMPQFGQQFVPVNMPPPLYQPYGGSQPLTTNPPQLLSDGGIFVPNDASIRAASYPHGPAPPINTDVHPQSPGSATRRSHAIEIKPPKQLGQRSTLDPKSPTYEPAFKAAATFENSRTLSLRTPSSLKRSPIPSGDGHGLQLSKRDERVVTQNTSTSSIDTTDFFPRNTHEHSSTRVAPGKVSPSTPQKDWPPSPWNPPSRSGSNSNLSGPTVQASPMRRPPSLTEEFSKLGANSRRVTPTIPDSGLPGLGKVSAQHTFTKPISFLLSTYQEGYQAGISHLGLPTNREVLRGFLAGLNDYLNNKISRGPSAGNFPLSSTLSTSSSVRGQVMNTTPRDSGVSMSFPRPESALVGQENMRSITSTSFSSVGYPRQLSGNQVGRGTLPTNSPLKPHYGPTKEYATGAAFADLRSFSRTPGNGRLSQLDGAMDDLAELLDDAQLGGHKQTDDKPRTEAITESVDTEASCFGKGKQKMDSSPAKKSETSNKSPAKARLGQLTNKLRREREDDPRHLSPEDKKNHKDKWHKRFGIIKRTEDNNVQAYLQSQAEDRRKKSKKPSNEKKKADGGLENLDE